MLYEAREITRVTKQDPDYLNPICFPHYTPECESDKYRIKTFKISEKDYVAQYAELFKEYHQVKGLPRITLNFQKTAFLKDEDTLIQLNPRKEMTILFILFDHFIAVQDGEARRFLIGHPLMDIPPSMLERHSRTYSPELSHMLNLILELKNAPDSNCFILIDRYQDQTLTPITQKKFYPGFSETFSTDEIIGFEVSNGDHIDVVENELVQDYEIAAFRCYTVQIYINGQLLEDLNPHLQSSAFPLSCITSDGMVRCIPYAFSHKPDCTRNFVLIPADHIRFFDYYLLLYWIFPTSINIKTDK